jgi:hypothetical protein
MAQIALIGDSHSQIHFDYLIPIIQAIGDEVVLRTSQPGWSINSFLSSNKLDSLASLDADTAIVALGGNNADLTKGYKDTTKRFLDFLKEAGIKRVVWLGPFAADPEERPDVSDRHEWTADFQKQFLPFHGVYWIDMRKVSQGGPWRDAVHFSSAKYKEMVEAIKAKLIKGVHLPKFITMPLYSPFFWSFVLIGGFFTVRYIKERRLIDERH